MLSAKGSNLVAGGTASTAMTTSKRVKVLRAFYYLGKLQAVGSVVDLPQANADEVLGMGKAVLYTAPPKVEAEKVEPVEAKPHKAKGK